MKSTIIDAFFNSVYSVVLSACKILVIVQVVVSIYNFAGRYFFNKTPAWGEETALLCLVWVALLSAALAVRDELHLRVTIIEEVLPPKIIKGLDILARCSILAFAIFMITEGIKLTLLTSANILPGLRINSSWLYLAVPVGGIILLIAVLNLAKGRKQ